jgi:hypothetical protein
MMKDVVVTNISSTINADVVKAVFDQYEKLVTAYRKGDAEGALNASGKFAEHALRGIEGYRTKSSPLAEIKNFRQTLEGIQRDRDLPEPVKVSIADALSMIFNIRSKRGAAHVKEIDPKHIDAALAVQSASWVLAELIRLFHTEDERGVAQAMAFLMRGNLPLIESFDDEHVVTTPLTCDLELLLQLARAQPEGLDRRTLGLLIKQSPSAITRNIQRLEQQRYIHQTRAGIFHITGPGEKYLSEQLAMLEGVVVPAGKKA